MSLNTWKHLANFHLHTLNNRITNCFQQICPEWRLDIQIQIKCENVVIARSTLCVDMCGIVRYTKCMNKLWGIVMHAKRVDKLCGIVRYAKCMNKLCGIVRHARCVALSGLSNVWPWPHVGISYWIKSTSNYMYITVRPGYIEQEVAGSMGTRYIFITVFINIT